MDTTERDILYDQMIEDITDKMELLLLKAMSSVLDSLMQAYWNDCEQYHCSGRQNCRVQDKQNDDVDWPF